MQRFCVTYTNGLVSKNAKICVTHNANPKICVTPNAKPLCEQVEYRSRWVPNVSGWHWPCRFHVVCVNFIHVGYNRNLTFSGIWAIYMFVVLCILITPLPHDRVKDHSDNNNKLSFTILSNDSFVYWRKHSLTLTAKP